MVIKVLIIDDSSSARFVIKEALKNNDDFLVVGEAENPYEARELIKEKNPDVLTLDIEMPKMDGITFLKNLMKLKPIPVVMSSSLTEKGSEAAIVAMSSGAVDCISKPKSQEELPLFLEEIREKIRVASQANVKRIVSEIKKSEGRKEDSFSNFSESALSGCLILMGSSTGGIEALSEVIPGLPKSMPPILITQHIPYQFSENFAKRLSEISHMKAFMAEEGMKIESGCIYLAPGTYKHLVIRDAGSELYCRLEGSEAYSGHRPSVDKLFQSALPIAKKKKILSILLTGMGKDGAEQMLELKKAGVTTWAQDEKSSVVWGMPGQAVKLGAVKKTIALSDVSEGMVQWVSDQLDSKK